ncbi:MAG: hypothetical protein QG608_3276, partial [Actinomycetota bacterium]|nr:hypothetical protein [Actinomycetota bacterium]
MTLTRILVGNDYDDELRRRE